MDVTAGELRELEICHSKLKMNCEVPRGVGFRNRGEGLPCTGLPVSGATACPWPGARGQLGSQASASAVLDFGAGCLLSCVVGVLFECFSHAHEEK